MNPKFILIDGKTYKSVDEMPEEVRREYERAISSLKDQNGNRIPDIVEGTAGEKVVANAIKIIVDGKEFNSIDQLPPEARAKYEKAMGALDANRNGIPDFMEGMMGMQQPSTPASTSFGTDPARSSSRTPMPVNATITPDTSNGWMLALLGIFLLLVCAAGAAGVWYFFLR